MDNPITPSLSELGATFDVALSAIEDTVRGSLATGFAHGSLTLKDYREYEERCRWAASQMRAEISRLMAQGGLRAGAAPLEEEVSKLVYRAWNVCSDERWPEVWAFATDPANCAKAGCQWSIRLAARKIIALLQASEGCGSSNPVDDGAVERVTVPIKPTQAMLDAGCKALSAQKARDAILVAGTHGDIPIAQIKMRFRWAAMIAALEAAEPHP